MEQTTAGLAFPLQNLMGAYGAPEPINDGSSRRTAPPSIAPENLKAAEHLEGWVKAGYFPSDANAIEYFQMMSRFIGARVCSCSTATGNRAISDTNAAGKFGFFLMPSATEGGRHAAMSAPLTLASVKSPRTPTAAAFFLNWVATNEEARKINVAVGGSNPGGPPDLPIPAVTPAR